MKPQSEAAIQQEIRLAAGPAGSTLFRNNSGAYKDDSGRMVRYGVASPGGADLIGWTPVQITQDMVGRTVAIFTAVEVKKPGGRVTPAQQQFIDAVTRAGGFAGIAHSVEEFQSIVQRYRTSQVD